jgi:hypothetical protein
MATHVCPKGHLSSEPDYCSECGSKIQSTSELLAEMQGSPSGSSVAQAVATPIATTPASSSSIGTIACPACGAPHSDADGNFCEICGYNFSTGQPADLPIATLTPPPAVPVPIPTPVPTPVPTTAPPSPVDLPPAPIPPIPTSTTGWTITIQIDPTLATPDSPPAPSQAPIVVPLNQATNLIGRTSAARGVTPEIPLDFDDAISHRHALLIVQSDGSLILRDIGSSNGVQFKGQDIPIMADIPLQPNDTFSLGHWTTITVQK